MWCGSVGDCPVRLLISLRPPRKSRVDFTCARQGAKSIIVEPGRLAKFITYRPTRCFLAVELSSRLRLCYSTSSRWRKMKRKKKIKKKTMMLHGYRPVSLLRVEPSIIAWMRNAWCWINGRNSTAAAFLRLLVQRAWMRDCVFTRSSPRFSDSCLAVGNFLIIYTPARFYGTLLQVA